MSNSAIGFTGISLMQIRPHWSILGSVTRQTKPANEPACKRLYRRVPRSRAQSPSLNKRIEFSVVCRATSSTETSLSRAISSATY